MCHNKHYIAVYVHLQSSQPAELTEAETEYMVACIKHIFPEHVVSELGKNSRIA